MGLDESTQPFARTRIEQIQRAAARAETSDACDANPGIEPGGPGARVSLSAFVDIGGGGTPKGMIGSAEQCAVHGAIGDGSDEAGLAEAPVRRRFGWVHSGLVVLALAGLGLGVGSWMRHTTSSTRGEPREDSVARPRVEAVPDGSDEIESPEPTPPLVPPETSPALVAEPPPELASVVRPRAAAEQHSPECNAHRELAARARRAGDWEALEQLAQRRECWARSKTAINLQLRALFELDRYRECIELGSNSKSKESETWVNNCARALR